MMRTVINSSLHRALLQLRKPTGCDQFIFTPCPNFSWENQLGVINSSLHRALTSADKTNWVWSIHLYTKPYISWENQLGVINSSLHWALTSARKPTGCDQFTFTLSPTSAGKTYWMWSIHLYTAPYFSWENLLGATNSSLHWALLQLRKPTGCDQFIFTLSPAQLRTINSSIHLYTEPYRTSGEKTY
jgi:hypothetical protein